MFNSHTKKLLITGSTGSLAKTFARICWQRNIPFVGVSSQKLDINDLDSVRHVLAELNPWAVINAEGYENIDEAEYEKEICLRDNVHGPTNLAMICREKKISLLTFSSDLVFNGTQDVPYTEDHDVSPLNTYGLSKALCEEKVLAVYPEALIIRSSVFFDPWNEFNFVTQTLKNIINQKEIVVASDCRISPTYLPDMINASLDLLLEKASGVYHLTNKGDVTWAELAHSIAQRVSPKYHHSCPLIKEKKMEEITQTKRPKNSCLISNRGFNLPPLEDAMERYFTQMQI